MNIAIDGAKALHGFRYSSSSLPRLQAIPASECKDLMEQNYSLLPGISADVQTYALEALGTADRYLVMMHYPEDQYVFSIKDVYAYQRFMTEYAGAYPALPALMDALFERK